MAKAKSKKAVVLAFTQQSQAVSAILTCTKNYTEAMQDYECANEARQAAKADLKYTVLRAAECGYKIEVRASKGTFAADIYAGLIAAGYSEKTASNTLTALRDMTEAKNTGKRSKKSKVESGPISGFTMQLGTATKPDVVKNKVVALAEYLKAEYPGDEKMLRIAAYLVDVSDA
jgi:hypothetical protein